MKDHPETPEPQPCRLIKHEEVQELTGPTLSGETALYVGTFVILCTLGAAILVIYEVANAAGNPADTAHSIITNLWHAGSGGPRIDTGRGRDIEGHHIRRRPPAPSAFQVQGKPCPQLAGTGIVSKFVTKGTADYKSAVGRPEIPVV